MQATTHARGLRRCLSRVWLHSRRCAAAPQRWAAAAAGGGGEGRQIAPPDVPQLARLAHIALTEEEVGGAAARAHRSSAAGQHRRCKPVSCGSSAARAFTHLPARPQGPPPGLTPPVRSHTAGQGLGPQDRGHRGVVWAAAGGGRGGRAARAAGRGGGRQLPAARRAARLRAQVGGAGRRCCLCLG